MFKKCSICFFSRKAYFKFGYLFRQAHKYDDLSYSYYYSNIALLSDAINISELKNHYVFYIGGAGTISFDKDDEEGSAFSQGESGVKAKVSQAIIELKNLLDRLDKSCTTIQNNQNNQKKQRITINLYGFSRGAFYARNFYAELKKLINFKVEDLKLDKYSINFQLGIFLDTVSSEGILHSNDVGEFDLDQVYEGMEIYHICAQDEFRYHFPLTSIPNCLENNSNSIEIRIPGSHSDIGGGYGEVLDEIDLDLGSATLADNIYEMKGFGYVPFYWFINKGYYRLNEDGRFFDNNSTPQVNGALTIRKNKVRCMKRRVYYPYQFVTAKIMQKIMIDNFGKKILDQGSEFCQQINNLKNWEIDNEGEHIDGIFTLSDYADVIMQWLPFRSKEQNELQKQKVKIYETSKAKLKESNIFDPNNPDHNISTDTMKYIYNNYIHYSLVNSPDCNKNELDMDQRQKNGFFIAYHANINSTKPTKIDKSSNFDIIDQFPYIEEIKIKCKSSGTMQYAIELPNKMKEVIKEFDRFILGADYKFINNDQTDGITNPDYGYLQERFSTTINNIGSNNAKPQLPTINKDVIQFCPIERVEIIKDSPYLLDFKWHYIFYNPSSDENE